jgi:hypothetical protein
VVNQAGNTFFTGLNGSSCGDAVRSGVNYYAGFSRALFDALLIATGADNVVKLQTGEICDSCGVKITQHLFRNSADKLVKLDGILRHALYLDAGPGVFAPE